MTRPLGDVAASEGAEQGLEQLLLSSPHIRAIHSAPEIEIPQLDSATIAALLDGGAEDNMVRYMIEYPQMPCIEDIFDTDTQARINCDMFAFAADKGGDIRRKLGALFSCNAFNPDKHNGLRIMLLSLGRCYRGQDKKGFLGKIAEAMDLLDSSALLVTQNYLADEGLSRTPVSERPVAKVQERLLAVQAIRDVILEVLGFFKKESGDATVETHRRSTMEEAFLHTAEEG